MVEMRLAAVRVELPTNTPVVLLQETEAPHRTLPIFIGTNEATAIAFALQGVPTPRPMTHDLLRDVITALGAKVDQIVITELREGTFYAEIRMRVNGQPQVVSSRPSDAIALAARTGTTIYAEEELIDAEGVLLQPDEPKQSEEPEELVVQFREFIEGVRPEDFSSGQPGPEGER